VGTNPMTDLILHNLLFTLALSLIVQAVFFAFAATLKTDKVTDLSYGLTFVLIAAALLLRAPQRDVAQYGLAAMVIAWGVRLAGYLVYRIVHMGRDARFDGIREQFWSFFKFWLFQGLAVWVIMLPVTLWYSCPWTRWMCAGSSIWLVGLVIEAVADRQKFASKRSATGRTRWTDTGLWRYSRHPNYFGELLCWWGVYIFVAPDLGASNALGIMGPLAITGILLFATGIPTLEASAEKKWGSDPDYQAYRRATSPLIPWFPR
jgi:steroid 5-alpha reductase family enzyme